VSRFGEYEEAFNESLRRARRRIYYLLDERTKEFSKDIAERICEVFVSRAKKRLLEGTNRATPNADSAAMVQALADSITTRPLENGRCSVVIPVDQEGLFMFLEFGTGLMGEQNGNPDAAAVGWGYALNRAEYHNGGWYFTRQRTQRTKTKDFEETHIAYVDQSDIYPVMEHRTRTYTSERVRVRGYSRNGHYVKTYTRKRPNPKTSEYSYTVEHKDTVFSKGLKPVRYIYDTKQEIFELFRTLSSYKKEKLTMTDVYKALDDLERRPV
jgi:hypothetical protein